MTSFHDAYSCSSLPITAVTGEITRSVQAGRRFVLSASPGSGKTTLVPLLIRHLMDEGGLGGRILIAQPRRVAVRSAATFVASLLGEKPGERVGWTMRADRVVSKNTRIEFTTTGTLLRRLLADPDLPGVDALILDEVHERHLDSDLALAFALDIADMRDDLLLGVMSATADNERFHGLLSSSADTDTIIAQGKPYPLDVVWSPISAPALDDRGASSALINHLSTTAIKAFDAHGSTLVFAPSIRDVETVVEGVRASGIPAYPLHGSLTGAQQDAALNASEERVIVATDIAETSLTVPGVNCVVDSGLSRVPRFDVSREATELVTVRESRSSAVQRAGRAHRTGPGTVYRCYSQTDYARMMQFAPAQMDSADLTEAALLSHAWSSPAALRLPTKFPAPALTRAEDTLADLGALEVARVGEERIAEITRAGSVLARVPADPRMAHALLLASAWSGNPGEVGKIVAVMSSNERALQADITRALRDAPKREASRFAHLARRFMDEYAQTFESPNAADMARSDSGMSNAGTSEGVRAATGAGRAQPAVNAQDLPGVTAGLAFPGRIAKRRSKQGGERFVQFLSAAGSGLSVDAGTPLASDEWIAASHIQTIGGITHVRAGAPLNPEWAQWIGSAMITSDTEVTLEGGRLRATKRLSLGAIPLKSQRVKVPVEQARGTLARALQNRGLSLFTLSKNARELVRKARYISSKDESWPELSNQQLADRVDELIGGDWPKILEGAPLSEVDVTTGLKTIIGWDKVTQLDALIPETIELPSGNRARIVFDPQRGPTVRVKLQECFGFRKVPTILGEPLTFELLSPAGRPLAITSDLENFFNESYADVRAQMRGRYPKHPWPEDPWTAPATSRTKRRM
ncbi:MAG: ATP-dependent helicase HrpB [Actinomycetaceae bacterium]|nr:ATP-dependent helicase HrpB [Actinomycetaceae bacterium]